MQIDAWVSTVSESKWIFGPTHRHSLLAIVFFFLFVATGAFWSFNRLTIVSHL